MLLDEKGGLMPETTVGAVAKAFLELLKLIKELVPDEYEKFEKEWKKDEKQFTKAWKAGDINVINQLFDKYWNMLQEV
jgi:hypothetical protein